MVKDIELGILHMHPKGLYTLIVEIPNNENILMESVNRWLKHA